MIEQSHVLKDLNINKILNDKLVKEIDILIVKSQENFFLNEFITFDIFEEHSNRYILSNFIKLSEITNKINFGIQLQDLSQKQFFERIILIFIVCKEIPNYLGPNAMKTILNYIKLFKSTNFREKNIAYDNLSTIFENYLHYLFNQTNFIFFTNIFYILKDVILEGYNSEIIKSKSIKKMLETLNFYYEREKPSKKEKIFYNNFKFHFFFNYRKKINKKKTHYLMYLNTFINEYIDKKSPTTLNTLMQLDANNLYWSHENLNLKLIQKNKNECLKLVFFYLNNLLYIFKNEIPKSLENFEEDELEIFKIIKYIFSDLNQYKGKIYF